MENLSAKIEKLINKSLQGLYERDEVMKLSFLALLSGESIFLLGPPGTAKSLVSRKLKHAVLDATHFEYLMNRFSTPEEIFGPISLKKLDDDEYQRKIEEYLPCSNIVFLDEIWKASPSIQNSLLTILNEKIYKNGKEEINVPLKLLIAASNELPEEGEGLEAIFDRFLIRVFVGNVVERESFKNLLQKVENEIIEINVEEKITFDEISKVKNLSSKIQLPGTIFNFIDRLRESLIKTLDKEAPYISDRRWRKISNVLRVSALLSGANMVRPVDLFLIPSMIWENEKQHKKIVDVFRKSWSSYIERMRGYHFEELNIELDKLIDDTTNTITNVKVVKTYKNIDHDFENVTYALFTSTAQTHKNIIMSFPIKESSQPYIKVTPRETENKYFTYYTKTLDKTYWDATHGDRKDFAIQQDGTYLFKRSIIVPVFDNSTVVNIEKLNTIEKSFLKVEEKINWIISDFKIFNKELKNEKSFFLHNLENELLQNEIFLQNEIKIVETKLFTIKSKIKGVKRKYDIT